MVGIPELIHVFICKAMLLSQRARVTGFAVHELGVETVQEISLEAGEGAHGSALRHCAERSGYRLENWKLLRAFLWPNFLRSTIRASRVKRPPLRRAPSRSGR